MKKLVTLYSITLCLIVTLGAITDGSAQRKRRASATPTVTFDENLYSAVEWRSIGPFRGGRSAAVTGVPGKPKLFYMGATGGGVWKTMNGGSSWENISDGFFGYSIELRCWLIVISAPGLSGIIRYLSPTIICDDKPTRILRCDP